MRDAVVGDYVFYQRSDFEARGVGVGDNYKSAFARKLFQKALFFAVVENTEAVRRYDKSVDREITVADLYAAGLTGKADSAEKRREFLRSCALPARLTGNTLIGTLNTLMTYEEFCTLTGLREENDT